MKVPETSLARPAAILGVAFVVGCAILIGGFWLALDRAATRLDEAIRAHGASVGESGVRIGGSVDRAAAAIDGSGRRIADAAVKVATPEIKIVGAVPVAQPVTIRGVADDGSMPVNATIGK